MPRPTLLPILAAIATLFAPHSTRAAAPEIHFAFPSGGQRGKTVEITLVGKQTSGVERLYFSNPDITAERTSSGKFQLQISADAARGVCEFWAASKNELSPPAKFVVTDQPQQLEIEPNDKPSQAKIIPLHGVVDAQLQRAADLDWFRFDGKADQNITIVCSSLSLDGRVLPSIAVEDESGRELAHDDGTRREPTLRVKLPRTGTYRIRICDRSYAKNERSFYRLSIHDATWTPTVFPRLIQGGTKQSIAIGGYDTLENKPRWQASVPGHPSEIHPPIGWRVNVTTSVFQAQSTTGVFSLAVIDQPVTVETTADNGARGQAQPVSLPAEINGRFATRTDVDWFQFQAKKGRSFDIRVFGERLNQLMDIDATIYDAKGKLLVTLPDIVQPKTVPSDFPLASLDAETIWKAPQDGSYFLVLRDLYGGSVFGHDRQYQLSIRPTQPDFESVAVTYDAKTKSGLTVSRGASRQIKVIIQRRGGFKGAVTITGTNLPKGISIDKCVLGAKEAAKTLTIRAARTTASGFHRLTLAATAKIENNEARRRVAYATTPAGGSSRRTTGVVILVPDDNNTKKPPTTKKSPVKKQ